MGKELTLTVHPFRADCTDKEQAVKVLEEASEAREAWQRLDGVIDYLSVLMHDQPHMAKYINIDAELYDLGYELADTITACANMAYRYGIDMQTALDRCEQKNRERGWYDDGEVEE